MKKRLIKDKILFAVEKNNYFIDRQINELAGKYKITILTSSLKIKKKFQNNFQVKFIKNKNKLEAFLEKISIFLSSPNFSKKEAYYNSLAIKQSNFLKKIYLLVKKIFWPKKNINFTSSNIFFVLFRFFYNEKNFIFLKKYKFIIYDSRFFQDYNYSKGIIFAAHKFKKIIKINWVYSWDNIFTGNFLRTGDYFLVWSDYIKKRLSSIQDIKAQKIISINPIQFHYLRKIKKKKNILLYPCSFSGKFSEEDGLVNHDLLMINNISKILDKIDNKIKLLVRLYPDSDYQNALKMINKKNVIIDKESLNLKKNNFNFFNKNLLKKNSYINKSILVLSFGTTFSLEAMSLGCPNIFLGFSYFKPQKFFLYDLNKYTKNIDEFILLKKIAKKNYVFSHEELKNKIDLILKSSNYYNLFIKNSLKISKKFYNIKNPTMTQVVDRLNNK